MAQQRTAACTATPEQLLSRYDHVRGFTLKLCEPLTAEDMSVQAAPCASPTKWHLAHTTWFFERFVLRAFTEEHPAFSADFERLFNSYYNTVGSQHPRQMRGVLSRPGLGEVMAYRDVVDDHVRDLLGRLDNHAQATEILTTIELGLHHEQQHQELLLTDIKLLFSMNPLEPSFLQFAASDVHATSDPSCRRGHNPQWLRFEPDIHEIGHDGDGFAYDNEGPRHRRFIEGFEIASRPVTNSAFAEFVEDDGYGRHELWLDAGWSWAQSTPGHPLYWRREGGHWSEFMLRGRDSHEPNAPVSHLSFFEADAFARWAGARLPTEAEWEVAARAHADSPAEHDNTVDRMRFEALPPADAAHQQWFGDVWEWTGSAHEPYPGYERPPGAIGEYNGKFMCGTFVLRGGSCLTHRDHLRLTYRNFLHPSDQWQCSGLRLARSIL